MLKIDLDDTIAAITTPIGEGGIGIVRLSGKEAFSIADKIFISKNSKKPSEYETYTTHYGWIVDRGCRVEGVGCRGKGQGIKDKIEIKGDVVDEVILTVMRAPKSYTREDVVEINCHGGIAPLKKVLDLVLGSGARLAQPGEFTKRAFLNGRIDLAQAEAVLDIIMAKTQRGLEAALFQLDGGISGSVRLLKERLLDIKVHLEASVDFPEEELSTYSASEIVLGLRAIKQDMEMLLRSFESGKLIREGINCVICGKANVGKSSLMNELLKEERVIVTPIPGTTRDAISEYINVDGIPMNIVDTAGISDAPDPLEKEGVRKSRIWVGKADLILFMMDVTSGFSKEDEKIIELIKDKEVICVANKIDLGMRLNIKPADLNNHFGREVPMNLEDLFKAISAKVWKGEVFTNDFNILTNTRHKDSILKTLGFLEEALSSLAQAQPEEIVAISLNDAVLSLGEITGESISEEVLDRIFEQFCVGK
jgi:tRNA modification GTPase